MVPPCGPQEPDTYRSRLGKSYTYKSWENLQNNETILSLPTIPSISNHSGDATHTTAHFLDPSLGDLTAWTSSSLSSVPNVMKMSLSLGSPGQSKEPTRTIRSRRSAPSISPRPGDSRSLNKNDTYFFNAHIFSPQSIFRSKEYTNVSGHSATSIMSQTSLFGLTPEILGISERSIHLYDFIGTLGRGTYGKVLLAYLKENPDGDLYATKVLRRNDTRGRPSQDLAGELSALCLVSECYKTNKSGVQFLQLLLEDFQDENFVYLVLEYHPTILSDPETALRFRVQWDKYALLFPSASLPSKLTFSRLPAPAPNSKTVYHLRLLVAEISLGLSFLHSNGIVHQDIKPSNIMISYSGHAVIGDLGAAQKLPPLDSRFSPVGIQNLARANGRGPLVLQPDDFITFTPLYAAPELRQRNCAGLVVYDERVDWWSLGVLIYELITGYVPFSSSSDANTLQDDHRLSFGHLENIHSLNSEEDWCPPLDSFIRLLLVLDPNNRLSGPEVKLQPFFDPICDLWTEITALKHPPCPDPVSSRVDDSVSFDFNDFYDHHSTPTTSDRHSRVMDEPGLHKSRCISLNRISNMACLRLTPIMDGVVPPVAGAGGVLGQQAQDEVDSESVVQALPSTASIWFNDEPEEEPSVLGSAFNDPGLNISINAGNMILSSENMGGYMYASSSMRRIPSKTSTPSPVAFHDLGDIPSCLYLADLGEQAPSMIDHLGPIRIYSVPSPDLVLQERITLSLLEAMDMRDYRSGGKQSWAPPLTKRRFISRRFVPALIQRTWKKVRFW